MANSKSDVKTTSARKREQIDNIQKQLVMWLALAGSAAVLAIILTMNISQKISYQLKVNSELGKTKETLESNVKAINQIKSSVNALASNDNLNLENIKGDDSTALQVVLDALPTENDQESLGSSLQAKVFSRSGAALSKFSFDDSSSASASTTTSTGSTSTATAGSTLTQQAQPMGFSATINGNTSGITDTLKNLQNSIRTINVNSMQISGSDNNLEAKITANAYYSPKVEYKSGTKTVEVGDGGKAASSSSSSSSSSTSSSSSSSTSTGV